MLAGVAIGALVIAVVLRLSPADLRYPPYAFSVPHPFWLDAPVWLSVAAGALLVAWGVRQRRIDVVTNTLVGAVLAAAAFFLGAGIAGWKVVDRRELPDGRTFIWFIQVQWLDPPDHLARLEGSDWLAEEYVVVGTMWGGRPGAPIITPRAVPSSIHVLGNGTVAVIPYGSVLVAEGQRLGETEREAAAKVPHVPVFALIGDSGEGHAEDVTGVLRAISLARGRSIAGVASDAGLRELPGDSDLADALTHANPWVRETARQFILAGGEEIFPLATRALR